MSSRKDAENRLTRRYRGETVGWAALYGGRAIAASLLDVADAIRENATEARRANDIAEAREKRLGKK